MRNVRRRIPPPYHVPFDVGGQISNTPNIKRCTYQIRQALKNQWEVEVRKTHVDGRLGATVSSKLIGLGLGGGGGSSGGGLAGMTGAAREACLMNAFEKAVMRLWPAFCHIDAQRRRGLAGKDGKRQCGILQVIHGGKVW